ncbi:Alpha/Beta hydrolase protein [Collybia nuda]|uniref:Alpha/Beta hydrolase protein n=1 Tax=Collybia nuda TaxID=64659 RepID=A0A9P5Y9B7_9AGAR|nr:Alpha/Beta hydrolase protein [Collybia nuda]
MSSIKKVNTALLGLGVLYGLAVLLVMTPLIQTHVLYAHRIDFFGYNKFDHPEDYGLAPGKTVNLKLRSADNTSIGAWFVFADKFYHTLPFPPSNNTRKGEIVTATKRAPTILFLHGNTGTRALHLRVNLYTAFTSRLGSNVLAIDYRGFADSEGQPTVDGVAQDARTGWNYLIESGARPEDILIVGHSLGTAIAGLLSAELGNEGISPRGLVLMSAFSSVRTLMDEYYLFGCLPLLKPLAMIPLAPRLLNWSLVHKFDTLTLVPAIKSSVLIAHAENDWDIQHSHSSTLFNTFLDPHLPELPELPQNPTLLNHSDWSAQLAARNAKRAELVSSIDIHNFGAWNEFTAGGRMVAMLKTKKGSHDIGKIEGLQDYIGRMFQLL